MGDDSTKTEVKVIGMDLGNRETYMCELAEDGTVVSTHSVTTTEASLRTYLKQFVSPASVCIAMETGSHSPWVSHLLLAEGFEVLVGNARKLRAIWSQEYKSDVRDAEMLARIARFDPALLHPIRHRSRQAHLDLTRLKARDILVRARSSLANFVRGTIRTAGLALKSCSVPALPKHARLLLREIPALHPALDGVLATMDHLTQQVRQYDREIEPLSEERYPETAGLRRIKGVGPITALGYVLALECPERFAKSRDVGPYLGLVPRRDQSGQCDRELPISKAGNAYLRRLLVGCARYILGPFGEDCDLRRTGERLVTRGGRAAKKKAIVAVARKLAVLLHRLWETGETYDPHYNQRPKTQHRAA